MHVENQTDKHCTPVRFPGTILLAAFIMLGCAGTGSLVAKELIRMTPGKWIHINSLVERRGVKIEQKEGGFVGYCDDGDWVAFGPLQLADGFVDRMEIDVAAPATTGRITVHLDHPKGLQVAEFKLVETGGYFDFKIQQADAEQLSGVHRLVLLFRGGDNLCNVKRFRFLLPGQDGTPGALRYEEMKKSLVAGFPDWFRQLMADHEEPIKSHRTTLVTVRTRPGALVQVKQLRHDFPFGTAIRQKVFDPDSDMDPSDRDRYLEVLQAYFNSAVHVNALKWYSTEKAPGEHTFENADRMLDWCLEKGLSVRGHCVYWGRDKLVQEWIKELGDDALRQKLHERARMVMQRYKGRITEYDVNNEMVHCHYFKNRLGPEIRHQMFAWCREYDPDAVLYVNDYSILTGGSMDRYIKQIRGFLDAGVPVGGIGVQGHFGSRVDGNQMKARLDELAKFGLPIKITELDINISDEYRKAKGLITAYVTAFAHPAVAGITLWGFWEGAHWRPNAALWKKDWTETLAARYHTELIYQRWWTDFRGQADAEGRCRVRVFYGDHEVTIGDITRRFSVRQGASAPEWSML